MEAIALIITKFSEELVAAQLALLFFVGSVAFYWLLLRKKKKESAEWVPAALVRAYLDRMQADERETRWKLFGEQSPQHAYAPLTAALNPAAAPVSADPNLLRELEALRAQLSSADQRGMEFDRQLTVTRAEKAALEQKLKDVLSAGPAGASTAGLAEAAAAKKEAEELRAKLQEYEVIEDDLANLKKFQKENEQLRLKVEQYEKGATVVAATPAQAIPVTTISATPAPAPTMTVISGGGASAGAAAPVAAAPETNTNVLQPVTPVFDAAAPAAPAAEKTSQQKEQELLSEFEKMLAS